MERFSSSYRTSRDGGLYYSYEATWWRDGDVLNWEAVVFRNGQLKARPDGRIVTPATSDAEALVKALVESAIERLTAGET